MDKYDKIRQELARATRRKLVKVNGKSKPEAWTHQEALKRAQTAMDILRKHGFEFFVPEAGIHYDGKRTAHVVTTTTTQDFNSWVVSAWIDGPKTSAQLRKNFSGQV